MPNFLRDKICAKLREKGLTKITLAGQTGLCRQTVYRALDGRPVDFETAEKISNALGVETSEYLDFDKPRFKKDKITFVRDDGTRREAEIAFYEKDGEAQSFSIWGDDEDFRKAICAYFYKPAEVESFLAANDKIIVKKISGSLPKEIAAAVDSEIKKSEEQGYFLDTLGISPDGRHEVLLLFKKENTEH